MSDVNSSREMSLKEVAYQYGEYHSAATSYDFLDVTIKQLHECKWWQFRRRKKLIEELYKEIIWLENVR